MNGDIFIIVAIILLGFLLLFILLKSELAKLNKPDESQTLMKWLTSMQGTIDATNKALHDSMRGTSSDMTRAMQENTRALNERLDTASKVIGDLRQEVGQMAEVGRGIKNLQEFLQSPKLRGNIGEQVLSDMIGQTFPRNAFKLQYQFRSGVKVDAALKTDGGLLCIDSKFPMENFTKMHRGETEEERLTAQKLFAADVRKHISDISKKYILPEEGTLDFALMYIPSEAVYYEIVNTDGVMDFARGNRIYPVSPNTLYAHLQVLLLSFQGKELEKKSAAVMKILRSIHKDYERLDDQLSVLGKHVTNAYNTMGSVNTGFAQLGQKLVNADTVELPDAETEKLPEG
jgi:DNA recombination protein RmuC